MTFNDLYQAAEKAGIVEWNLEFSTNRLESIGVRFGEGRHVIAEVFYLDRDERVGWDISPAKLSETPIHVLDFINLAYCSFVLEG